MTVRVCFISAVSEVRQVRCAPDVSVGIPFSEEVQPCRTMNTRHFNWENPAMTRYVFWAKTEARSWVTLTVNLGPHKVGVAELN